MSTLRRCVPAIRRATLLVALPATLLLSSAGLASAEKVAVDDADESGTASDVSGMVVVHRLDEDAASGGRVVVRVHAGEVAYGDLFDVWVDVPGDRTGKLYHARILPDAGYDAVQKVDGWRVRGTDVCDDWSARLSAGPDQVARFSFPRSCFDEPGRVRVAARVTYRPDGDTYRDWVPATKQLSAWVSAS